MIHVLNIAIGIHVATIINTKGTDKWLKKRPALKKSKSRHPT